MVATVAGIETGDAVKHTPTGETWVVACVEDDRLSWVGWPEGSAPVADCVLIEKGTADSRSRLLRDMARIPEPDHRGRYARRVLAVQNQ